MNIMGIPLLLSQQTLYVLSCLTVILSIRKLINNKIILSVFYVILIFNPDSYASFTTGRYIRDFIYTSFAIIAIACVYAIYLRRNNSKKNIAVWSVLLGVCVSAMFLTREDAIWIMPIICMAIAILFFIYIFSHKKTKDWKSRIALLLLPFIILGMSNTAIALINKAYYGVFVTNEYSEENFIAAYSALCRVKGDNWIPDVPITKNSRMKIYSVSPAFKQLEPYMEGEAEAGYNQGDGEMHGGWINWALRNAVYRAGFSNSAADASNYYKELAKEVNSACDSGKLSCYPSSKGFGQAPPWRGAYFKPLIVSLKESFVYSVKFKECTPFSGYSEDDPAGDMLFSSLANDRAFNDPGQLLSYKQNNNTDYSQILTAQKFNHKKLTVLLLITKVYQQTFLYVCLLGILLYVLFSIYSLIFLIRKHRFLYFTEWLFSTAAFLSCLLRLLILAYVNISSFPTLNVLYMAPVYPLMIISCFFSFDICYKLISEIMKKNKGKVKA